MNTNTFSLNNNLFREILNPLEDHFEIRDILSLDAPVFGNLHISITNIGLYLIIAALALIFFVWSAEQLLSLNCWTSTNIPHDKQNDLLYLKLGWQSANTTFNLESHDIYSSKWGLAGSLVGGEKWRLNKIADRAESSGALKVLGLQHDYKGRITYIGTNKGAKSTPQLIAVLRIHDIV